MDILLLELDFNNDKSVEALPVYPVEETSMSHQEFEEQFGQVLNTAPAM